MYQKGHLLIYFSWNIIIYDTDWSPNKIIDPTEECGLKLGTGLLANLHFHRQLPINRNRFINLATKMKRKFSN